MATPDTITPTQLARLVGTPDAPPILDVRIDEDHARDPRAFPASVRRDLLKRPRGILGEVFGVIVDEDRA